MRRSRWRTVASATVALTLVVGSVAIADTINTGEIVNDVLATSSSVERVPGSSGTAVFWLVADDNETDPINACNANGAYPVTITVVTSSIDIQLTSPTSGPVTGCGTLTSAPSNARFVVDYSVAADAEVDSTITLTATGSGGRTTGPSANPTAVGTFTPGQHVITVIAPPVTNTAPSTPGVPVLEGVTPNKTGIFGLTWAASTDDEGDAITYTLERRNFSDAVSTVASSLSSNAYEFNESAPEGEGTWEYRVKASDGELDSAYSNWSDPVVVDKSAPNPPTAATDRDAEDEDGGWFKNAVTVAFTEDGDPDLADGSSGSGVESVTAPQTFNTSGEYTASGTATDVAGNVSEPTHLGVKVDADEPTVDLVCPSGPVILGSAASANWAAKDGHSGLATAETGSIELDTSAVGQQQTATAPAGTAVDKVGLESKEATCEYSVVYDFDGFFRPVEMEKFNRVKAGQAVPMKFSLGGDQGLDILQAGYPKSYPVPCNTEDVDLTEPLPTVTSGKSSLTYDADADQYSYVWKTEKNWAGTCRAFSLGLNDDSEPVMAYFNFTR
jgi:hypothetical protein